MNCLPDTGTFQHLFPHPIFLLLERYLEPDTALHHLNEAFPLSTAAHFCTIDKIRQEYQMLHKSKLSLSLCLNGDYPEGL